MSEADPRSFLATRWSKLDQLGASGTDEAWRWFIDRYRPFARSVLRKILGTHGRTRDLESAVEEFWAYLFSSDVFRRADRSRRFRSFLAGTLRNFARDHMRRNPTVPTNDEHDARPEPAVVDPLPEDEELRIYAHQVLHLALQQLERSHRDNARALRWFYGVGQDEDELTLVHRPLGVSEIAERLGIQPNAVHQVLFRGRKRLRQRIEAELRETVLDQGDYDKELQMILSTLGGDAPGLAAG